MWSALMRLTLQVCSRPVSLLFHGYFRPTQHYMTSTLHFIFSPFLLFSYHFYLLSLCFSSHSLLIAPLRFSLPHASLLFTSHHVSCLLSTHISCNHIYLLLTCLYTSPLLSHFPPHFSPLLSSFFYSPHISPHVLSSPYPLHLTSPSLLMSLLFSPLFMLLPHLPLLFSCHISSHNILKTVKNFSLLMV